jgi:two-component system phosphate regulon response regulator PhoB
MSIPPVIIIAEPDPIFGNMLRVEFSQAGFAVLMAATGPEAEAFARQTVAQLVLLDTALPGVTCFDACARIRRRPNYEKTPIVLTVRTRRRRVEAAADVAGATLLLVKPYAYGDLLTALEKNIAPDHPVLAARAAGTGMAEQSGVHWGPLPPLTWRFSPDSGLSQNARVLPIMRSAGTWVPLKRRP